MSRRCYACLGVTALAVAALLVAAEPASAQRGGRGRFNAGYGYGNPYYGGSSYWGNNPMYSGERGYGWGNRPLYSGEWGYGRGYYPGYSGGWWNSPGYGESGATYYGGEMAQDYYTTPSDMGAGYGGQSYGAPSAGMNNQVLISVRVPPNAEIWFDDQKTTETGSFRSFLSPPLTPNKDYVYQVRAHWMQNGQPMDKTRKITVHAGDRLFVNLMSSGAQNSGTMSSGHYGATGEQNLGETHPVPSGAPEKQGTSGTTNTPRTPPSSNRPESATPPPPEKP